MHAFKDAADRSWELSLTVGSIRRLKAVGVGESGKPIDLLSPEEGDPPGLTRLASDPWTLVDALYVLLQPQADKLGVTDEAFGEAMGGAAIFVATEALWAELSDFFRSQNRMHVVMAIHKQAQITAKGMEIAEKRIAGMDPEALVTEAMEKAENEANEAKDQARSGNGKPAAHGSTFGKQPEFSELIHSP